MNHPYHELQQQQHQQQQQQQPAVEPRPPCCCRNRPHHGRRFDVTVFVVVIIFALTLVAGWAVLADNYPVVRSLTLLLVIASFIMQVSLALLTLWYHRLHRRHDPSGRMDRTVPLNKKHKMELIVDVCAFLLFTGVAVAYDAVSYRLFQSGSVPVDMESTTGLYWASIWFFSINDIFSLFLLPVMLSFAMRSEYFAREYTREDLALKPEPLRSYLAQLNTNSHAMTAFIRLMLGVNSLLLLVTVFFQQRMMPFDDHSAFLHYALAIVVELRVHVLLFLRKIQRHTSSSHVHEHEHRHELPVSINNNNNNSSSSSSNRKSMVVLSRGSGTIPQQSNVPLLTMNPRVRWAGATLLLVVLVATFTACLVTSLIDLDDAYSRVIDQPWFQLCLFSFGLVLQVVLHFHLHRHAKRKWEFTPEKAVLIVVYVLNLSYNFILVFGVCDCLYRNGDQCDNAGGAQLLQAFVIIITTSYLAYFVWSGADGQRVLAPAGTLRCCAWSEQARQHLAVVGLILMSALQFIVWSTDLLEEAYLLHHISDFVPYFGQQMPILFTILFPFMLEFRFLSGMMLLEMAVEQAFPSTEQDREQSQLRGLEEQREQLEAEIGRLKQQVEEGRQQRSRQRMADGVQELILEMDTEAEADGDADGDGMEQQQEQQVDVTAKPSVLVPLLHSAPSQP